MSHHHHHHHHSSQNIKIAFLLNLIFAVLEIIGGFYVNSVAIISDAIHDLGDSLSLGTAWYLEEKSRKGSDHQYSFGYARFSLLGALINSLILILGAVFVVWEAVGRIIYPESTDAGGMMVFAILGVLVNGYAAWKVGHGNSLNEKVVSWHLWEDVLGWIAVLIASLVMYFIDNQYIDPGLSLLITVYILWGVAGRLRETIFIFLQGIPKDIDLKKLKQELLNIEHIQSLHHTHIWSLEGEHHVLSIHLKLSKIDSITQLLEIKCNAKEVLKKYPFRHYTIETELFDEICDLKEF